ncbi:nucleoside triphosphate pyrophosphohydrolase [bacterium]|nr:MAG: nucleoside triphosphate pyrophosphohydrolase [bacterium]
MSEHYDFDKLVEIVERLRRNDGCPWDRAQTHESIKQYLIEEAFEVVEAIEANDDSALCEELGDLLLHIVFHSQMGAERGAFDIDDVTKGIVEKIIGRHPHVFGEGEAKTAREVLVEWERIKLEEKSEKTGEASLLDGLPMAMPALLVAQRMQEKAARIGFDWPDANSVWVKVEEEFRELEKAIEAGDRKKVDEEFGDFLFALTNMARFLELSSEMVLRESINKFKRRFSYVEKRAREKKLDNPDLKTLDIFWDEAKKLEAEGRLE